MNVIQTTARVMMTAMIAVCIQSAEARKTGDKPTMEVQKPVDTVTVYRTDTIYINNVSADYGELNELAQIANQYQLEAYKARLKDEKDRQIRKDEASSHRKRIEDAAYENKAYFKLIVSYFYMFMFGMGLPCLVVFLYLHYSKNRQQRYEMLIDLVRSGVEIKPELIDALSLSRIKMNWHVPNPKTGKTMMADKAMAAQDYIYCLKRVIWALACLIASIAFSSMTNNGVFFGFGVIVAVVLLVQAAVRYLSLQYISRNTLDDNHTSTAENNAQQP